MSQMFTGKNRNKSLTDKVHSQLKDKDDEIEALRSMISAQKKLIQEKDQLIFELKEDIAEL